MGTAATSETPRYRSTHWPASPVARWGAGALGAAPVCYAPPVGTLQRDVECTVGARRPDGSVELLAPGRMVYVGPRTALVPGTTLSVGDKLLVDLDGQRALRVRPASLAHTDLTAFKKLDAALVAGGLGDLALGDAEAWLRQEWATAASTGRGVGPTDPTQELDRRLSASKRRFPVTWWHDTPEPGAQELAREFLAPRGLPTALPTRELEDDLRRRTAGGQTEAQARAEAIARLVAEANLLFQRAGLAERFIPFAPHAWEEEEPVWYLLTPVQARALVSGGVLRSAAPAPLPGGGPEREPPGWRAVLFRPRSAFPRLAEESGTAAVVLLASLWGIERFFYELYADAFRPPIEPALQIVPNRLFWGALFGVSFVWGIGNFMPWFTRRLGGQTTERAVRAVLAWAALPKLVTLAGLLALYAHLGDAFVLQSRAALIKAAPMVVLPFNLLYVAVSAWSLGLSAVGLAAVSRLTTWKAIQAWVLAGVVLFVPAMGVLWAIRAARGG